MQCAHPSKQPCWMSKLRGLMIRFLGWFFNLIGKLKSKCIHLESRAQFINISTSYSRFLCLTRIFSEPSGSTGSKHLVIPSCTHRGDSLVLFSGHRQNHSRHIHHFCSQSISSPTPGKDRFLSFHMPAPMWIVSIIMLLQIISQESQI